MEGLAQPLMQVSFAVLCCDLLCPYPVQEKLDHEEKMSKLTSCNQQLVHENIR